MSYGIQYVIQCTPQEFLLKIPEPYRISEFERMELANEGVLAELRLWKDVDFFINPEGNICLGWMPDSYTSFLNNAKIRDQVLEFEESLLPCIGEAPTFRASEFLTSEFEKIDELWFLNDNAFEIFSNWLAGQDSDYYSRLI